MKNYFTLLLTFGILFNALAESELFLKINKNGNFIVSVNDQSIQSSSGKFRFFDLYNGNYTIVVRENTWGSPVVFQQTVPIRNGYRYVAEISPRNGIHLIARYPYQSKSWYLDNVNVNVPKPFYNGNPNHPNNGNHNGWYNKDYDDYDAAWFNSNWNDDDVYNNNGNWNTNNNTWNNPNTNNNYPNNNNNGGWYNPNQNNGNWYNPNQNNGNWNNQNPTGNNGYYNGYATPMSDAELQTLLVTMKSVSFEEKMIDVAKSATKNRTVNTLQIRQLLQLFSFEKNKLDLAKYCYDITSDKNNYYTLVNAFTFSSNQKELTDFINRRK